MKISLVWLNQLLQPGNLSAASAEELLTGAGFPIESTEAVALSSGAIDHRLDVEVTSNRGDALCHVTLARELAAVSKGTQRFVAPSSHAGAGATSASTAAPAERSVKLRNDITDDCPRFTLRVIRGVKVGPSPAWLVAALEAIGLRSINNVVDATNYVQAELGNPSHVFDLAKVALVQGSAGAASASGAASNAIPELIVRRAANGETLALLDGKSVTLVDELVVADASGPISLAGVMGGASSGVSNTTTDVLLEVATWKPELVRKSARRLNITSDAGHRFQRIVDARTLITASDRLVEIITALAGGTCAPGVVQAGKWSDEPTRVTLRCDRARSVIGLPLSDAEIRSALQAQGFVCRDAASGGEVVAEVPHTRTDVRIEIDLIEEVARTIGYDRIEIPDTMSVRVSEPQKSEIASREIARVLTGAGFFETVTFSFTSAKLAKPFLPPGLSLLRVSDDRRGGEGVLRPSVLIGLLGCRRINQDRRADTASGAGACGVRLFETASVFAELESAPGKNIEHTNLGLLCDFPADAAIHGVDKPKAFDRRRAGFRQMRGAIEAIITAMHGPDAALVFTPGAPAFAALDPGASASITLNDQPLGVMGIASPQTLALFELDAPVVLAELNLAALTSGYPPASKVAALPTMAAIERDVSAIVGESVTWDAVRSATIQHGLEHLEALNFVSTYRGQPIPDGKKSVTFRMRFRHPQKTFRDEEINAPVSGLMGTLTAKLGAEFRKA